MAKDYVQMDLLDWPNPYQEMAEQYKDVGFESCAAREIIENARRDGICPDWQACMHHSICFAPQNEQAGICFIDEPDKLPRETFSRCELKVLTAGFSLIRYTREEKKLEIADAVPTINGWGVPLTFSTYAAAERKLKELKECGCVETDVKGKIVMSGWFQPEGLKQYGFEFYRVYGFHSYDTSHCIKVGSKNWSNLAKYKDRAELRVAWSKLMSEDPKALEG